MGNAEALHAPQTRRRGRAIDDHLQRDAGVDSACLPIACGELASDLAKHRVAHGTALMNKPPLPLPLSIQRARDQVTALDTLAAALSAGLHAGVINPTTFRRCWKPILWVCGHAWTSWSAVSRHRHRRRAARKGSPPTYKAFPMVGIVEKG